MFQENPIKLQFIDKAAAAGAPLTLFRCVHLLHNHAAPLLSFVFLQALSPSPPRNIESSANYKDVVLLWTSAKVCMPPRRFSSQTGPHIAHTGLVKAIKLQKVHLPSIPPHT
jgi:hypothetical protein